MALCVRTAAPSCTKHSGATAEFRRPPHLWGMPTRGKWTKRAILGARMGAPVVLGLGGLAALKFLGPDSVDSRELIALFEKFGVIAPLAFVVFLGLRPVALLPGQLLTAVGGMVFGAVSGTVYALVGSFLSTALLFYLSRRLGTGLMRKVAGRRYGKLQAIVSHHERKFLALTAINPLIPTDVVIVAAAASGARFRPAVTGVLLGTLPGTILTAQFGSALGQDNPWLTAASALGLAVSLGLGTYFGRRALREIPEAGAARVESPVAGAQKPHRLLKPQGATPNAV
jgi:uncharacterized membrane protein YdjX (TVP38/TMEM64 family)